MNVKAEPMYRGPLLKRDLREARKLVKGKPKETAVAMLLRRDFSYAQIGEVLEISKSRVARIVKPLNMRMPRLAVEYTPMTPPRTAAGARSCTMV